ncbi:MAG: thioredoxin-disulfide reductase [Deltaproteobacteria bacterium]|nr:thioredoxin-disulfide reductase [Deltaproteobacteria bacterium]
MIYDVVILGSGPSGLTAAVYCARANLKTLVLEGIQPGGQLTTTTEVENFPGFPQGILGPELINFMKQQASRFGCEFTYDTARKVEFKENVKKVYGIEGNYNSKAVIIATGARSKFLGLPNEKELIGYGVSTCATCDGAFFRGKIVGVVGGGDSAAEESLFLTRFAEKVYLIHRRDSLRASKIMQQRLFVNPKIEFIWNATVEEIIGTRETKLKGVKLKSTVNGDIWELQLDGLFLAIGHTPNTEVFEELEKDEKGYIKTKIPGRSFTSVEGVFVAGDCSDYIYRQAITAAGFGCMAALDCARWLEEHSQPR